MIRDIIRIVSWTLGSCIVLVPLVGQTAGAGGATAGPPWIYGDTLRGAPWVSLGDEGGQLFAHFPPSCDAAPSQATLFSTYGTTTNPVWIGPTRCDRAGGVDSATRADVHVAAVRQAAQVSDPGPVRVARWSSSSSQPDWVYTHPTPSSVDPPVGIARDGSVVVAPLARPDGSGVVDVLALDGLTGVVVSQTALVPTIPGATLSDFVLAGDGQYAAVRLGTQAYVVDVLSGAVAFQLDGLPGFAGPIGISADGDVLSWADAFSGEVHVLECAGGSWLPATTWTGAEAAGSVALAVSDDGSTVAAAFGTFPFPGTALWTVALDVPTRTEIHSEVQLLCCGIGFGAADLAITADGARFVVGVRGGDELELAERVRLYARDQASPLATWSTGFADLVDVALSSDGNLVAVGSGEPAGGGLVYRFRLPGSDFRVEGEPALGAPVEFALDGAVGESGVLLSAFAPAVPPLVLPGNGTLYLDPSGLRLRFMGPVQPDGSAHLSLSVPTAPSLLGLAVWTQGLRMPVQQLSEDWHKLTLLP